MRECPRGQGAGRPLPAAVNTCDTMPAQSWPTNGPTANRKTEKQAGKRISTPQEQPHHLSIVPAVHAPDGKEVKHAGALGAHRRRQRCPLVCTPGAGAGRWTHVTQTQAVGAGSRDELAGAVMFAHGGGRPGGASRRHLPALHAMLIAAAGLPSTAAHPPGYCCCRSCRNSSGRRADSAALTKPRVPAECSRVHAQGRSAAW